MGCKRLRSSAMAVFTGRSLSGCGRRVSLKRRIRTSSDASRNKTVVVMERLIDFNTEIDQALHDDDGLVSGSIGRGPDTPLQRNPPAASAERSAGEDCHCRRAQTLAAHSQAGRYGSGYLQA